MQEAMGICDASAVLLNERWGKDYPAQRESDSDAGRQVRRAPSDHFDFDVGSSVNSNPVANNMYAPQGQAHHLGPPVSAFHPDHDSEDFDFDPSSLASPGISFANHQGGLGHEMQVSPSDTTSAATTEGAHSEVYETNMDFYATSGDGGNPHPHGLGHDSYGYLMEGQGEWIDHVLARGSGDGGGGHL